jgi:hypothetical protein
MNVGNLVAVKNPDGGKDMKPAVSVLMTEREMRLVSEILSQQNENNNDLERIKIAIERGLVEIKIS